MLVTDADQPLPVVTIAAAASEVTEGEPVQFTVSADLPPATWLTVNVAVSESRSRNMMSGALPRSVTLRAGAGSAALTVHTDDDSVAEDDSTVTAALQPGTGYQIGDPGSAGVRVVDNDRAPIVPMGFAYVPFDEPDDRVDTNDPPRRTPESDWPHRPLGLPFGVDFHNATGNPPTGAAAAHRQGVPLAAPMKPLDLQRWRHRSDL